MELEKLARADLSFCGFLSCSAGPAGRSSQRCPTITSRSFYSADLPHRDVVRITVCPRYQRLGLRLGPILQRLSNQGALFKQQSHATDADALL
jgi:hypothetical protein